MSGKLASVLKTKLVIVASVAAGATFLAVMPMKKDPDKQLGEESELGLPKNVASAEPELKKLMLYRPQAGSRYIYSFRRALSFEGELAGAKIPSVSYGGEFYVDVLESGPDAFEAILSDRIAGIERSRAPLLRVKANARAEEVTLLRAPPQDDDDGQHLSVIKDLLSLWFFPLRADTTGAFQARFESLPAEKGFLRVRKTKLEYLAATTNSLQILNSRHHLLWSETLQLPFAVRGVENTKMGSGSSTLTATSRYELRFLKQLPSPTEIKAEVSSLQQPELLALRKEGQALAKHPEYAGLNWTELKSRLLDLDKLRGGKQLELFGDLVKFLRLHPENTQELAAQLLDPTLLRKGSESLLFRILVGTLATVGSPEAGKTLREAYEDPSLTSVSSKGTILAALTTTQSPIDLPTREFLAEKMQSERDPRLAQGAAFALGSALQKANDEQASRAIQQIEAAWNRQVNGSNLAEQLALLDVMGNSGRAEFLPKIQALLSGSGDTTLKAKAVFALRFIQDQSARQELLRRLADKNSTLREAAAEAIAIADWEEGFRSPLAQCAKNEEVLRIQEICTKTLANNPQLAESH